jgi:hypothetical protein
MYVYVVFVCNIMLDFARTFTTRANYEKNIIVLCAGRGSPKRKTKPITMIYPSAHVARETVKQSQRVLLKINVCNTIMYELYCIYSYISSVYILILRDDQ